MLVKIRELCDKNSPYFQLGVRWKGTEILQKHGVLEIVDINNVKYVEYEKLLKHVAWEKNFFNEYFIDLDVWSKLGSSANKDSLRSSGVKKLISLANQGLIEMVELDYPLVSIRDNKYKNIKRFFKKASLEYFLNDYINLNEAMKIIGKSSPQYTLKILMSKDIEVVKLSEKYDMTFVNKKAVLHLVESGENKLSSVENRKQLNISDMQEYISSNQSRLYLGFTKKKFEQIQNIGILNVETIVENGKNLYKRSHIEDFKKKQEKWEQDFIKKHYIDLEVWGKFGSNSSKDSLRSSGILKLIELANKGKIELVEMKYPLIFIKEKKYENIKRFFKKDSIELFLLNHFKLEDAMLLLGRKNSDNFQKYLKSKGIEIIKLSTKVDLMYVRKFDIHNLMKKRNIVVSSEEKLKKDLEESEFLNRKQVMMYLNITAKRLTQLIEKRLLRVEKKISSNLTLFKKSKVIQLKKQQEILLKLLNEKWFTRNEVIEKFNYDPDMYEIRKTKIPVIVASADRFLNKRVIYLKSSVEENFNRLVYTQQYYTDVGTIYDNIKHRLQMEKFSFFEHLIETEKLWDIYIKSKSNEWNPNSYDDKLQRIGVLVNLTKDMNSILSKEIYNCSSKELNFAFFNKKYPLHFQKHLYSFLQAIHLSQKMQNKVTFRMNEIINPYDREQKRKIKSLYTPKEYRNLFDYVSENVSFHKSNAINSIKKAVLANEENKNINMVYDRYDSAWLYVILHLTNIWRTPDYLHFPRVSFEDTYIEPTIEWMENNEISKTDAERLLRRLQIKTYNFSKNNADRYLFIPDKLLIAFATAVTLCEIRTRLLNDSFQSVINFMTKDNRFRNKVKENFFRSFSGVQFDTLKMNRSLFTFLLRISKNVNGPHEIEILKQFRGHKNIETTNIYLLFTEEDINFLTSQLFSRNDHFGFIADTFTDILFGETTSLFEKTKQNNSLLDSFGGVFKLESVASFLLAVSEDEEIVKNIILEMDSQETQQKFEEILFMKLTSKQKDVQCLIGEANCPYPGRDCLGGCHFSIPHFYAISELTRQLWNDFEFILNRFSSLKYKGDKERFFINFAGRLKLFKNAEGKYGNVVYEFFNLDKEKWIGLLSELPEEWQLFVSENRNLIKA